MTKFWSNDSQVTAWVTNERSKFHCAGFFGSLMGWCLVSYPLSAQVTPDGSLGTETSTENNVTEITGGTRANSNLFHSFQEFSVETGNTAYFNNSAEISNIIGRVTGSSSSNIDGLIRANGDANLILINANGITLGSNARLDIGGSFLGSTANSVVFADGTVFNTNLNTQPLLTITAPVGLQLGQDSAAIEVSGTASTQGLEISPGHTFALVGNGITFDGGVVTAESGRIDLGSIGTGQVSISEVAAGWELGYESVSQFGELQLLDGSALLNPNISANSTGGIQVQGSKIVLERSQIAAQTLANAPGGNIVVNASESLALSGTAALGENSSQISNNVRAGANAQGGSIDITTGKLDINPRSFIDNSIFGAGSAGDIKITAQEINLNGAGFLEFQQKYRLDVLQGTLRPGSRLTGIFAGTATTGTAGDITIDTNSLNLTDGAIIFTPVYTAGQGGNINVTAQDISLSKSAIQNGGGVDSLATASLGNINLTSDRLKVSDGATVINATFGDVSGGNIQVTADSIDLSRSLPESIIGTGLFTNTTLGTGEGGDISISANTIKLADAVIASNSGAVLPDDTVIPFGGLGGDIQIQAKESIEASGIVFDTENQQLSVSTSGGIGTSTYSPADGGNLTINTGRLFVRDGANLSSSTLNSGDGGKLTINAADSVELLGFTSTTGIARGGLFASSEGIVSPEQITGTSGNISIITPNLTVRDGAIIDVQSSNLSDAGSIDVVSDLVLLTNRGALSATTKDGSGGNIRIDTKVLQLNRGLINASVLGKGTGGNIDIIAQDSVNITGSSFEQVQSTLFDPKIITPEFLANLSIDQINNGIIAASISNGNAGRINIQTTNLAVKQGGLIATATAGNGAAGSILLNTSESLVVDGSFISNNTLFSGRGGNIAVDTSRLEILQGGRITASTLGRGNGGNVAINARESVTVTGNIGDAVSNISVGARLLPTTTGNGGDLTINTPQLKIDDRAALSIGSTGSGDAGSLEVNADSIIIDRQGAISADTQSGEGGNISLNAGNIFWRGGSFTTATSRGTGNGGNITIQANNLLALEGSRVTANAVRGKGGNIQIDTKGLFLCDSCQVTASSELGLDGVVDIETLEPTTLNSLDVPQQLTQPQQQVAVACPSELNNNISQLTITGRGGLPNRPQEPLNARSLIEFTPTAIMKTPIKQTSLPVPARGWYRHPDGQVVLTANAGAGSPNNSPIQSTNCHH